MAGNDPKQTLGFLSRDARSEEMKLLQILVVGLFVVIAPATYAIDDTPENREAQLNRFVGAR